MSKQSSYRVIQGLYRLHNSRFKTTQLDSTWSIPSNLFSSFVASTHRFSQLQSELRQYHASSKPTSADLVLNRFFRSSHESSIHSLRCSNICATGSALPKLRVQSNPLAGLRLFSSKGWLNGQKINASFARNIVDKPVAAIASTFGRYREAVGLHVDAFWRRNNLFIFGAGAIVVCALLWRIMFGIANTFVGLSEGMAKYGFLALSSAIVAFAGLYIRSRSIINPDRVYRMTMRKLNTAAEVLEVMGAPLSGSDLRAYVMSGGGITLKHFKPRLRSKRCFLIFPVRGSERKGLVSVEVKKKKGQYDMKLLAIDIPMASGPDQRLFLIGDEEEYRIGGGLISELRDPVVKAMSAVKEFDDLDRIEEEEDEERELQEAERKRREEIEKFEKSGMP